MLKRRELITNSVGLAAGSVLASLATPAQSALPGVARRIDVHHHAVPQIYTEALASIGITASGGVPFPQWSPEASLRTMALNGISTAVLSLSSPGVYFGEEGFAVTLARAVNEYLGSVAQSHPGKLGYYATLPLPLVEASLSELRYALDQLQADGVCLLANSQGIFLGDRRLDPLLAELDARQATVLIHPNTLPPGMKPDLDTPPFAVEFVVDTTRAVMNMLWNGTFERYPNIRWILSHAGGTVPFIAWRMRLLMAQSETLRQNSPRGVMHYLGKLFYDTALSPSSSSLFPIVEQFGSSQLVLGTDYPFAPAELVPLEIAELTANAGNPAFPSFTAAQLQQVFSNGYRLFPRLQLLNR